MGKSKDKGKLPPKEQTESSSSSSGEDTEDIYKLVFKCAEKMPTKEERNKVIEEGFNKYTLIDRGADLPKWFLEDEKKHYRRVTLGSQEEVEAMKEYFAKSDAIQTAKEKPKDTEKLKVKPKQMKKGKGRKKGQGSSEFGSK